MCHKRQQIVWFTGEVGPTWSVLVPLLGFRNMGAEPRIAHDGNVFALRCVQKRVGNVELISVEASEFTVNDYRL